MNDGNTNLKLIIFSLLYADDLQDVLKLYLSGNYSIEEMIFNNIDGYMISSVRRLDIEVRKIEISLSKYGVEKNDIETLMYDKLIKLPKEKTSIFS